MFNKPPPPTNRAVYEVMWKNTVQPGRPEMTIYVPSDGRAGGNIKGTPAFKTLNMLVYQVFGGEA